VTTDEVIIKPRFSDWDFADREQRLFESVRSLPTWRLANQSRRLLADVVRQLFDRIPLPEGATIIADLAPEDARQLAATQLAAIVVRTTGAQMSLIACGYEREALGPVRTAVEALLRLRQVNDEQSAEVARQVLAGRRPRS